MADGQAVGTVDGMVILFIALLMVCSLLSFLCCLLVMMSLVIGIL